MNFDVKTGLKPTACINLDKFETSTRKPINVVFGRTRGVRETVTCSLGLGSRDSARVAGSFDGPEA